jgi:hypothetical protein
MVRLVSSPPVAYRSGPNHAVRLLRLGFAFSRTPSDMAFSTRSKRARSAFAGCDSAKRSSSPLLRASSRLKDLLFMARSQNMSGNAVEIGAIVMALSKKAKPHRSGLKMCRSWPVRRCHSGRYLFESCTLRSGAALSPATARSAISRMIAESSAAIGGGGADEITGRMSARSDSNEMVALSHLPAGSNRRILFNYRGQVERRLELKGGVDESCTYEFCTHDSRMHDSVAADLVYCNRLGS